MHTHLPARYPLLLLAEGKTNTCALRKLCVLCGDCYMLGRLIGRRNVGLVGAGQQPLFLYKPRQRAAKS